MVSLQKYSRLLVVFWSRLQGTDYRLHQATNYRLQQIPAKIQQVASQLCLKSPNQVNHMVMVKIDKRDCGCSEQCTLHLTSLYYLKSGLQKLFRAL